MTKPFAIATNRDEIVTLETLEKYVFKQDGESSRALTEDVFVGAYNQLGLKEPIYNPLTLAELLELNTWHARCCNTKANDIAGLGWGLTSVTEKENPDQTQHEVLMNFFRNGIVGAITLDDLLTAAVIDWEAIGDMYLEITREGNTSNGLPALIRQLPAHTIRLHKDGNKFCQIRGQRRRWFKAFGYEMDIDFKDGKEYGIGTIDSDKQASEIIHIKHYHSRSDYYGLTNIITALGAIEGLRALRDYNISFFDSFGVPSYAVYITGDYDLGDPDEDGKYEIVKEIKVHLSNIKNNPHAPLILAIPSAQNATGEVNIEFKPLAIEVKEASFRLYRKDSRDEILVAHGMPPYRIGVVETGGLGGNIAVESTAIYKISVIAPRKRKIVAAINNLIIKQGFGFTDWEFWLEDLDTQDEAHDVVVATFLFDRGSITPNELIRYFGERFNIVPDEDEPALNYHYLNGQPMEKGVEVTEQAMKSIERLHDRLTNIAIKDEASASTCT